MPSITDDDTSCSVSTAATPYTCMTGCSALRASEISYFLLVYMQEGDADAVINALATLIGSMPQDKEEFETEEWKQKRDWLMWTGAPAVTTLTMKKWKDHEQIQIGGFIFYTALTCGLECGPSAIAACGGVEAIVDGLKAFPDSCDVQGSGFGALANIFAKLQVEGSPEVQAAHQFVEQLDGLNLVRTAMKNFPDKELQGRCCLLLGNLAMAKQLRKALASVIVEVSCALRDHPEYGQVRRNGRSFMKIVLA